MEVLRRYEVGVVPAEAAVQDTDNVAGQVQQRRVVLTICTGGVGAKDVYHPNLTFIPLW